jgi:hypothetical protein
MTRLGRVNAAPIELDWRADNSRPAAGIQTVEPSLWETLYQPVRNKNNRDLSKSMDQQFIGIISYLQKYDAQSVQVE